MSILPPTDRIIFKKAIKKDIHGGFEVKSSGDYAMDADLVEIDSVGSDYDGVVPTEFKIYVDLSRLERLTADENYVYFSGNVSDILAYSQT